MDDNLPFDLNVPPGRLLQVAARCNLPKTGPGGRAQEFSFTRGDR